jgi:hypothetical protein
VIFAVDDVAAGVTNTIPEAVAVALLLVTVRFPEVPAATTATICVDVTVTEDALVPPNFTFAAVVPVKLVPVIVTRLPVVTLLG